jgi:hypothetical protein
MSQPVELLGLYLHLAQASRKRNRPHVRDRLLVLAGVIAARMNLPEVSAYCRMQVLAHNPGHLIGRWPDLTAALGDSDFLHLLRQLQRRYPQEKAEQLLANLGVQRARERETYFTDEEYAAAILGHSPESLRAAVENRQ